MLRLDDVGLEHQHDAVLVVEGIGPQPGRVLVQQFGRQIREELERGPHGADRFDKAVNCRVADTESGAHRGGLS
jgi:hypothetical protein